MVQNSNKMHRLSHAS